MQVDLQTLGLAEGGYLLLKRALRRAGAGGSVLVSGGSPALETDLPAWCRSEGHTIEWQDPSLGHIRARVTNGGAESARWLNSQRAGSNSLFSDAIAKHAPRTWGLAGRGAYVEAGAPEFNFQLVDRVDVWSVEAASIYRQAAAAQWDP